MLDDLFSPDDLTERDERRGQQRPSPESEPPRRKGLRGFFARLMEGLGDADDDDDRARRSDDGRNSDEGRRSGDRRRNDRNDFLDF